MRAKRHFQAYFSAITLTGLFLVSACGKADDLPSDVSSSLSSALNSGTTSKSDDEIKAAIPKILKGLDDIKQEIKGLQLSGLSPTAPASKPGTSKPGTSAKPGSTPAKPATDPAKPAATDPAKPATPAAPATPSASAEFQKMLQTLAAKPFVQASVEKTEKSFKDGHVSQVKLNMYTKAPSLVKLEIVSSTSGAAGAKIIYNSGDTNKAKIRPGGSLSFMTTELPKSDDRLLSTNQYKFDDIDLFGVVKRWSAGYTAELVGKTQLNGSELYILKVKAPGKNGLDERIDYEYVGYEPDTYKLRLWEMYTPGVKDPFFRLALPKLEYPDTIADTIFKL